MTLLEIQPIALQSAMNADGVMRVGGTRVTLDTVVRAFLRGAAAEEIAQQYPSLSLTDVYAAISYYLQHRAAVEKYFGKARQIRQVGSKTK